MTKSVLPFPLTPPEDRGPLMDSEQVAKELLNGQVDGSWCRDNLTYKRYLGRKAVWYRVEAQKAIDEYFKAQGAA